MRLLSRWFCLPFALALLMLSVHLYVVRQQPNQTAFIIPPPRWMEQDDIYRLNPDGSNPVRLTNDHRLETDIQPSPHGDWIVFTSDKDVQTSLYSIDLNGFQQKTIAKGSVNHGESFGSWSPDGKWLTYTHNDKVLSYIGIMQADGSQKRLLTDPVGECKQITDVRHEYGPRWLDNWIYFHVLFCNSRTALYRIHHDGSERQEIMPLSGGETCWYIAPDLQTIFYRDNQRWSLVHYDIASQTATPIAIEGNLVCDPSSYTTQPDPDWFFFSVYQFNSTNFDFYRIAWDASMLEKITPYPLPSTSPLFAPDGAWIYFEARLQGKLEVYRMHLDGSGVENLTNHPANDNPISVSPDGAWIYFTSDRSGTRLLHRMRADGSAVEQLPIYSRRRIRNYSQLTWLPLADKPWHDAGLILGSGGVALASIGLIFRRTKES